MNLTLAAALVATVATAQLPATLKCDISIYRGEDGQFPTGGTMIDSQTGLTLNQAAGMWSGTSKTFSFKDNDTQKFTVEINVKMDKLDRVFIKLVDRKADGTLTGGSYGPFELATKYRQGQFVSASSFTEGFVARGPFDAKEPAGRVWYLIRVYK